MRTLRIRTFTLLCLVLLLILPWIFYVAGHFMETKTLRFSESRAQNEVLQRQLSGILHQIETGADQWKDPNWQQRLNGRLEQAKIHVVIASAADREIYRSSPKRPALSSTERYTLLENGRVIGKVVLYLPKSSAMPMMAAFAGLLLASFIIGVEMRRFLLKPLETMSHSARQIAEGDWDVKLPASKITEIAEVRDGFDVMVKGLRTSYRKQAELEEERRFVIAAVAHDLRTPLFALRGYLDGLEQGIARSPEKISKYVAVCKEKSAQLDRLVEDLFTFTKMEYVETKLHHRPIDFSHILQRSADSLSPQARQKQIAISIEAADGCIISGDEHLLERAMNNLLDNAVRHTPAQGKITVECYQEGRSIKFAIRDTGTGFTPEELERVFDPLFRGETSRNRSTGGSGLGLTISRTIIRRHGGELAASNHPEGGALLAGFVPAADPE